ncbi:MAG: nucleoside triphosphate pyrophosphohydrolase [candidate division WOR-3 bacterium]
MFDELLAVVRRLRQKCPWDRKQTVASTRPLVLNEAYELDEALGSADPKHIAEELGDYLFMGIFLADVLAAEHGTKLEDVLRRTIAKLKTRHPHIYGSTRVSDAREVLENWERIKRSEPGKAFKKSVLDGLPRTLPALKESQLVQERCGRLGFDWSRPEDVLDKVVEETNELRKELTRLRRTARSGHRNRTRKDRTRGTSRNSDRVAEELGDLFFALVNLCRHLGLDAESVLRDSNAKFRKRFELLEQEFHRRGRSLARSTLREMDRVWNKVKAREK